MPKGLQSALSDCLLVGIKLQVDDKYSFNVNEYFLNMIEARYLNVSAFYYYYVFICSCRQANNAPRVKRILFFTPIVYYHLTFNACCIVGILHLLNSSELIYIYDNYNYPHTHTDFSDAIMHTHVHSHTRTQSPEGRNYLFS